MASNIHTGRKIFLSASMKFHGLPGGLSLVAFSIRLQTKKALNIYIVGYAFENEFVCDYSSFIKSQQSKVSIQAISDCVVYEIALNELVTYWEVNLDNLKEGKKAAENLYELAYDRFLDSYCSPMIRYKKLMSRCPKLKEKVPLRSIASFLGVTPETISHIRKKIRLDGKS